MKYILAFLYLGIIPLQAGKFLRSLGLEKRNKVKISFEISGSGFKKIGAALAECLENCSPENPDEQAACEVSSYLATLCSVGFCFLNNPIGTCTCAVGACVCGICSHLPLKEDSKTSSVVSQQPTRNDTLPSSYFRERDSRDSVNNYSLKRR